MPSILLVLVFERFEEDFEEHTDWNRGVQLKFNASTMKQWATRVARAKYYDALEQTDIHMKKVCRFMEVSFGLVLTTQSMSCLDASAREQQVRLIELVSSPDLNKVVYKINEEDIAFTKSDTFALSLAADAEHRLLSAVMDGRLEQDRVVPDGADLSCIESFEVPAAAQPKRKAMSSTHAPPPSPKKQELAAEDE